MKEKDSDFRTYVTILKRFEKPTSALGIDEWVDKHFDHNLQAWDFRYWKPSRVEIVYRRLFDDNDIQQDPHAVIPLLWTYETGQMHYFKNDKNDTSLVLSEQED